MATKLLGEDLPDGTHVVLNIQSYSAEYKKDEAGNLVLGYLSHVPTGDENIWTPVFLMKNETIREIRDSFRHWQQNKTGDAFVWITLTSKPESAKDSFACYGEKNYFFNP